MAGKSDYLEKKLLDHATGKASMTSPTTNGLYMALCTVVPTDADTGATITEANYTGYTRIQMAPANVSAAAGTSAEAHNTAQLTGGACTAGSSACIGFAMLDSATVGAGNVHYWGTLSTVTVTTTQTPPTLAASALSITED